jgi:hypothetical protein
MRGRRFLALAVPAVLVAAVGCSDSDAPDPPAVPDGLIVRLGEESGDGGEPAALVQGIVSYEPDTKCFHLEVAGVPGSRSPIVWPPGTTLSETGVLRLPSGAHVEDDAEVSGGGMSVLRDTLEQIDGVSYELEAACFPDGAELSVFNRTGTIDVTPG